MKTIFVISPDYLDAILEEAKRYQFVLQGYGNFKIALERLMFVNGSDLIGIAFVAEELPSKSSKEWKYMLKFFETVNCVFPRLKVKIVVRNKLGDVVQELRRFSNLKIAALEDVEIVTDIVINKDVFGSLLLSYYQPYESVSPEMLPKTQLPEVVLQPLISPVLLGLTTPVSPLFTLDLTLEKDEIYQMNKDSNWLIATLREIQIKKMFLVDTETQLEKAKQFVNENSLGGEFQAIIHLIEKGVF